MAFYTPAICSTFRCAQDNCIILVKKKLSASLILLKRVRGFAKEKKNTEKRKYSRVNRQQMTFNKSNETMIRVKDYDISPHV
jgi:hypothetical protein